MSRPRSDSSHSSSSSTTTASANNNENSNVLYNDREHYEVIFKNDSRFFDTSLHLFKSYRKRGYLPPKTKKRGKSPLLRVPPGLKAAPGTSSSGTLGKSKGIGFSSNHNVSVLPNNGHNNNSNTNTMTATQFRRNQEQTISLRSDPGLSKLVNRSPSSGPVLPHSPHSRPFPSSLPPQSSFHQHRHRNNYDDDDDDSDGPDIIVTRL